MGGKRREVGAFLLVPSGPVHEAKSDRRGLGAFGKILHRELEAEAAERQRHISAGAVVDEAFCGWCHACRSVPAPFLRPFSSHRSARVTIGVMGRYRVDNMNGTPGTLVDGTGRRLSRCYSATGAVARMVGLLGTPDLRVDEALHIDRCRSVHTFGMRIAIDVVFLDRDGVVVRVVRGLRPGRVAAARRTRSVVETREGVLSDISPGDHLRIDAQDTR